MSRIRVNFAAECEAKLNGLINAELHASYVYQSMSFYFQRDDVALKGFEKFFHESAEEKNEHGNKLMKYINRRGGDVVLTDVAKPQRDKWGTCLEALQGALKLEKMINQSLLDLHSMATAKADPHLCYYLEEEFLEKQVERIYKLSHHLTNIERVGTGLGEYMFDKKTLEGSS